MNSRNHWLTANFRTLFRLRPDERIEHENDPDGSPGPLFWLAGSEEGNVYGVHAGISNDKAEQICELAANEPHFTHSTTPRHLECYLLVLAKNGPVSHNYGLIYELPHAVDYPSDARLIGDGSDEGQRLIKFWEKGGVPESLFELGFREVADLWKPWCIAIVDDEIASIAFASRLGEEGAELGLATVKGFRGRGFAAAATAGWSRLPQLRARTLFYSTDRNNKSSQRVTERLDLKLRGASLRIFSA